MEKQKYSKEEHDRIIAIFKEKDDVKRWRLIHDLLRDTNPRARREQKKQAKELKKIRDSQLYNNKKSANKTGLVFSVSIPNVTWQALVEMDTHVKGKSELVFTDKGQYKSKNATNEIAKKLSRAFPEYRVS